MLLTPLITYTMITGTSSLRFDQGLRSETDPLNISLNRFN